ncbi:MAG: O-antigen ligase family protein [Bacteroidota bacterium]
MMNARKSIRSYWTLAAGWLQQPSLWRGLLLAILAISVWGSLYLRMKMGVAILQVLPLLLVGGLLLIYNTKWVFWLLVASIPISINVELGSLALDVPTEPLMMAFLLIFLTELIGGKYVKLNQKVYPFHLWIILIVIWLIVTVLFSDYPTRSLKFLLSKLWYLAAFIYMGERFLKNPSDVKTFFWVFFCTMIPIVFAITVEYSFSGFSFEVSNGVAYPFFVNGVVYGAALVLFLPFVWYARKWYPAYSWQWWLLHAAIGLLLFAIVFTYKRGAWLATLALPVVVFLLGRKWLRPAVLVATVLTTLAIAYLVRDNTFYKFAPTYESTIWHEGNIQGHLDATFSGTEISGVERFYRWVAAKNMIADKPLIGFGPSTFNQVYKRYADDAFRTYVSDNPEQSTTHNYFLMTFSEQGFIGGLLFLGLCIYMVLKAAKYYHLVGREGKLILLMSLLSLISILLHSALNELIEVDKTGAMFWLNLLMIHKTQVWYERREETI